MRVITSLFLPGREGTDKSEGVPPRAVGCIWAVCYNVGNGERAEYMYSAQGGEMENIMKMKRTSEQFTMINSGSCRDSFRGKAEIEHKNVAYIVGYEVEFDRSDLPDYWGEVEFYVYVEPTDLDKLPRSIRPKVISSIRRSVAAEYDIYDI